MPVYVHLYMHLQYIIDFVCVHVCVCDDSLIPQFLLAEV